ncbi:MAG: beta-propeller domain-containing protein [archaeon]
MKEEMKNILIVGSFLVVSIVFLIGALSFNPVEPVVTHEDYGTFNSVEEIKAFLEDNSDGGGLYYGEFTKGATMMEDSVAAPEAAQTFAAGGDGADARSANDYSETNVQVHGVDEPDIVKNDGQYIYTVSGNKVVIVDAFPAEEMVVIGELEFEDDSVRNIFVNGDKLVIFTDRYEYVDTGLRCGDVVAWGVRCGGYSKQDTVVYIYDISDRNDPELDKEISLSGNYVDARMINDYVYLISSKYIQMNYFDLPSYEIDGVVTGIAAKEVHYFGQKDESFIFNTIAAIDLEGEDFETETYLMGSSRTIYVSEDNIYLTYQKRLSQEYIMEMYLNEVLLPELPSDVRSDIKHVWEDDDKNMREKESEIGEIFGNYMGSLETDEMFELQNELEDKAFDFFKEIQREQEQTVIHRIEVDGLEIDHEAVGSVPGGVLNQFSMDEYDGTFRIATTTGGWDRDENENNLYVLDLNLDTIGKVEGLAEGERIYSARFMGERAYMVTFRQIDPLFAIDLSDPENPEVMGELKVTGYSGYLHPYDEDHLLGIGMEATEGGRTEGVKISLFDVSNLENPEEVWKYHIDEGRWSSSEAINDHKAVLFDKEKNLLVIPVSYSKEVVVTGQSWPRYENWQGAYVFDVSLSGIDLKGTVVHERDEEGDEYWYGRNDYVRRSLWMDDVLYTISNSKVKANDLGDLKEIEEVELPWEGHAYYGRGVVPEPMIDFAVE